MKILRTYRLVDWDRRYLGSAFEYEGGWFSHSLLNHGEPMLPGIQSAAVDFGRTYDRLPPAIRGGAARRGAIVFAEPTRTGYPAAEGEARR